MLWLLSQVYVVLYVVKALWYLMASALTVVIIFYSRLSSEVAASCFFYLSLSSMFDVKF